MTAPDGPPADRNGSDMTSTNPDGAHRDVEYRNRFFPDGADPDVVCPSGVSPIADDSSAAPTGGPSAGGLLAAGGPANGVSSSGVPTAGLPAAGASAVAAPAGGASTSAAPVDAPPTTATTPTDAPTAAAPTTHTPTENAPTGAARPIATQPATARPHDRNYARNLRSMGARLLERVDGPDAADPPDGDRGRILPMIGGILQGRQALRDKDPGSVADCFASGILHLALIAFSHGDPHLRILDFLRAQRQRYDAGRSRHRVPWWDCPAKHHFERLIANALALTHEIDAREPSEERKQTHAADAANYALFLLHVSGVPLSDRPHPSTQLRQESHAP